MWTGGERGRGEASEPQRRVQQQGAEGKAERFPHRGLVLTSTHQPEMLVCSPAVVGGGWELRFGLQRSDTREETGVGCMRESGKKSGPAKEARDHFFGVHEERGFLSHEPTEGRAPLKRAPETGLSHSYQVGPQRRT